MRNVYIIIQNGTNNVNLQLALTKGMTSSVHPHENVHGSTTSGKTILNGLFSEEDILWFEDQSWAYVLGDYLPAGRGEKKVYDNGWTFAKPNKPIPPPPADSGFIYSLSGQFKSFNNRFRFIGVNKYNIFTSRLSQQYIHDFMTYCKNAGITVVRTWLFPNFFQYLVYPLAPVNLLTDPSFELNDPTWVYTGTSFVRSNESADNGTWSVKQTSPVSSYDKISQLVTVEPNKSYVWTIRYRLTHTGGQVSQAPPRLIIGTSANETEIGDYGFLGGASEFTQKQVVFNSGNRTQIKITIQNWGGKNDAFYDNFHLGLQQTPQLIPNVDAFAHADMVLDEAEAQGVKLLFSLADNNPNFNTKKIYVDWANTIYDARVTSSFPYGGFFTNDRCKQLYKMFIDTVTTRYKNRLGIFSWELGNELRVDQNDSSGQNTSTSSNLSILSKPGSWTDEMSSYIKSKDPNHMVGFGDAAHAWQWVNGDNVSNGTYYGIDYGYIAQLPNIDYVDYHFYPTQGGGEVEVTKKYGQRLGYPNTINTAGLEAQLKDFVDVAKQYNKPAVMSEVGFIREVVGSNAIIPLYPRVDTFRYLFDLWYGQGGDGVILWHGETGDGGSYSINIANTWNGNTTNLNYDDRPVVALITEREQSFV